MVVCINYAKVKRLAEIFWEMYNFKLMVVNSNGILVPSFTFVFAKMKACDKGCVICFITLYVVCL